MSQNQNSFNSNELDGHSGDVAATQSKQNTDINRTSEPQIELDTTSNQNSIVANGNNDQATSQNPVETSVRQREENPFSFKHFLKRDTSMNVGSCNNNSTGNSNHTQSSANAMSNSAANNICHSRSTSIINGSGEPPAPSKSATTSALNQNHHTGARPKIPQFQSVHGLASGAESKMKRSPRFPSFDSQSSLSELSDERSNLFHSRSNSSFNSDYPVQRSFSNYDMESPTTESPKYDRKVNSGNSASPNHYHHNYIGRISSSAGGNRLGNSEFPSALPDFVQDHIVMEQWIGLGSGSPKSTSPVSVDFEHLPDFTINRIDGDLGLSRSQQQGNLAYVDLSNDIPFEINMGSNRTPPRSARNPSPILPLDLPRNNDLEGFRREQAPPDLPPDLTEGQRGAFGYGGADMNRDQSTDKIQTLPDFLSDGPIHSSARLADVTQDTPHFNSPDENSVNTTIARLQQENDRLRNEIDDCRQIIINQTCRISELEHLLIEERRHYNGRNETHASNSGNVSSGANGLPVDGNSGSGGDRRDTSAQNMVSKLKQQVKQLTAEADALRSENNSLKEEGAVGGAGVRNASRFSRPQQLSRELRLAASTAENNLRQLLSGVDNLRLMAANIENMNRLSDPIDDFLSDDDDDGFAAGPAL